MKELMSTMPYVVLGLSLAAALTVVFVMALKTLSCSFNRLTAVVLAFGVTILAVVGTGQIVLVRSQPGESAIPPISNGNAPLLLAFVPLGLASLLAQLLSAVGGTAPELKREHTVAVAAAEPCEGEAPAEAQLPANAAKGTKPRGRPRKPSPSLFPQEPPVDSKKKTIPPKQSQPARTDAAGAQKTDDAVGSTGQP